jgi:2-polyprenyl-6-methoxyphenol hydroxylase-like FAD-dependent oxidoreductase
VDAVKRLDIHEVPVLPSFVKGRIALLGDAAHAMSPDRGQGAAQSIEDAVVLASLLDANADIGEALLSYDATRRPRARAIARDARRVGQSTINPGTLPHAVLTTMLRLMPRKLWIEATRSDKNPVWRWQPPIVPLRQSGP